MLDSGGSRIFWKKGQKNFKKGLVECSPRSYSDLYCWAPKLYILSKATFYDISKNISTGLGFKVDFSKSISIEHSNIKNGS